MGIARGMQRLLRGGGLIAAGTQRTTTQQILKLSSSELPVPASFSLTNFPDDACELLHSVRRTATACAQSLVREIDETILVLDSRSSTVVYFAKVSGALRASVRHGAPALYGFLDFARACSIAQDLKYVASGNPIDLSDVRSRALDLARSIAVDLNRARNIDRIINRAWDHERVRNLIKSALDDDDLARARSLALALHADKYAPTAQLAALLNDVLSAASSSTVSSAKQATMFSALLALAQTISTTRLLKNTYTGIGRVTRSYSRASEARKMLQDMGDGERLQQALLELYWWGQSAVKSIGLA